jgi:membrane associated rhomboid family serine protease
VLYTVITVPAYLMIGLWIVTQFFHVAGSFTRTQETGGVAYAAHVGGFLAGLILTPFFRGVGTRRASFAR